MAIEMVDKLDPQISEILGYLGHTPAFTCVADNRFCYFLYVPRSYFTLDHLQLIVLIHESARTASELRSSFASFAERNSCVVLAPLFPIVPSDAQDSKGYKLLKSHDVRYDEIVLSMAEEVRARFNRVHIDRFFLFGFSGGGQFVHRFAYLYPQHLKALACGAPGSQTLPDDTRPYPEGVKDLEQVFGRPIQWSHLRLIPTMFIVGNADTDTSYATARGRCLDPSIKDGRRGATARLEASWRATGVNSHLHVVPGVAHEEDKLLNHVMAFFQRCIDQERLSQASRPPEVGINNAQVTEGDAQLLSVRFE